MALKLKHKEKKAFTSKTNQIPSEANEMHFRWMDLKHVGAVKSFLQDLWHPLQIKET